MNNDLKDLSEWSNKSPVTFNPDKTSYGSQQDSTICSQELGLGNELVQYAYTRKHLGLWNYHIDNLMLKYLKMVEFEIHLS